MAPSSQVCSVKLFLSIFLLLIIERYQEHIINAIKKYLLGVTFNESLQGKYIDHNGNINRYWPEFSQQTQCFERFIFFFSF